MISLDCTFSIFGTAINCVEFEIIKFGNGSFLHVFNVKPLLRTTKNDTLYGRAFINSSREV